MPEPSHCRAVSEIINTVTVQKGQLAGAKKDTARAYGNNIKGGTEIRDIVT